MQLRELIDGWDLSVPEVLSIVLYSGPLYEVPSLTLRGLSCTEGRAELVQRQTICFG